VVFVKNMDDIINDENEKAVCGVDKSPLLWYNHP
jgi:hypothetical protein